MTAPDDDAGAMAAPPPLSHDPNWRAALILTKDGAVRSNVANAVTILRHDDRWHGLLAYDELAEKVVTLKAPDWHPHDAPRIVRPGVWTDEDTTRASAWFLRNYDTSIRTATVLDAVAAVARTNSFNPVKCYLQSLKWDGHVRLSTGLTTYFGADDTPYTRGVFTRWMISAVARAFQPGCKADCVLVLEGKQGIRKSEGLRALVPNVDWFFDSEIEFGSKEAAQVIRGAWIVEIAELASLARVRGSFHGVKAFLSRRDDRFRPSYGRTVMTFPRRCVFAGTTNDTEYLPDPTGNRRFWPVPCNCVDLDAILRDRDQLWAEAVMRFEQHEPWHVDDPEFDALCVQEQLERYTSDPWEIIVAEWLSKRTNDPKGVIMGDALFGALGVETAKQTKREQMRLAAAMAACGWAKGRQRRRNGIAVRPWYVAGSHYLACDPPGGSEVAT